MSRDEKPDTRFSDGSASSSSSLDGSSSGSDCESMHRDLATTEYGGGTVGHLSRRQNRHLLAFKRRTVQYLRLKQPDIRLTLAEQNPTGESLLASRAGYPIGELLDACCLRFLRAARWNVQLAAGGFAKWLSWKESFGGSGIDAITPADCRRILGSGALFFHGYGFAGEPILYFLAAQLQAVLDQDDPADVKALVVAVVWLLHRMAPIEDRKNRARMADQMFTPRRDLTYDPRDVKCSVIFDLDKCSVSDVLSMKPLLSAVAQTMQENFPERLYRAILWKPPLSLRLGWSVIKGFLDPRVAEKFLVGPSGSDLRRNLSPAENLLKRCGGKSTAVPPEFQDIERVISAEEAPLGDVRDSPPVSLNRVDTSAPDGATSPASSPKGKSFAVAVREKISNEGCEVKVRFKFSHRKHKVTVSVLRARRIDSNLGESIYCAVGVLGHHEKICPSASVDAERKATWTKGNTWSFAEGEASSIQMHIRGTQQAVRGAFCVGARVDIKTIDILLGSEICQWVTLHAHWEDRNYAKKSSRLQRIFQKSTSRVQEVSRASATSPSNQSSNSDGLLRSSSTTRSQPRRRKAESLTALHLGEEKSRASDRGILDRTVSGPPLKSKPARIMAPVGEETRIRTATTAEPPFPDARRKVVEQMLREYRGLGLVCALLFSRSSLVRVGTSATAAAIANSARLTLVPFVAYSLALVCLVSVCLRSTEVVERAAWHDAERILICLDSVTALGRRTWKFSQQSLLHAVCVSSVLAGVGVLSTALPSVAPVFLAPLVFSMPVKMTARGKSVS